MNQFLKLEHQIESISKIRKLIWIQKKDQSTKLNLNNKSKRW